MKKKVLFSIVLGAASIGLLSTGAMALTLEDGYSWSSMDYWNASQLDVDLRLEIRASDYHTGWFGLYMVDDIFTPSTPTTYALFDDSSVAGGMSSSTANLGWSWDATNSEWDLDVISDVTNGHFDNVSLDFGFFQNTQQPGVKWYTDKRLNEDQNEHVFVAYQGGATSLLDNAFVYSAQNFEDTNANAVSIVSVVDIVPAPVPEPATMLLFGSGLLALAGFSRRKK